MFCVVYEFKVKKEKKEVFLKAWSDFTKAIYRVNKSLGSRIHSTENPSVYIAYAQWRSEEAFNNAAPAESYTKEEQASRSLMSNATEEIKVIYKLNLLQDLLK